MKTYVIMLSKIFPKGHRREGEPTRFKDKLWSGEKIHTIRSNYELWEHRIKEVQKGEACISVRQWEDKPYRSKQIEVARFTKENGVGIESLIIGEDLKEWIEYNPDVAEHDGLTKEDWISWFSKHQIKEYIILPVIHFTPFRYYKSED